MVMLFWIITVYFFTFDNFKEKKYLNVGLGTRTYFQVGGQCMCKRDL